MNIRIPNAFAAIVFAVAVTSGGCSDLIDRIDGSVDDCMPGRAEVCVCPGGAVGSQTCNADGASYGACVCDGAAPAETGSDAWPESSPDDGVGGEDLGAAMPDPDSGPARGAGADASDGSTAQPAPAPQPDPDVTLNTARVRVLVVGGSMSVEVEADWAVTGRTDVSVKLQVLSSITYRAWTDLATGLPPTYFASFALPATPGERRFDFRVVATDAAGNEWVSNTITVQ